MKYIPADRLEPGMITTKPIYGNNALILASNHELTADTINAIQRNGIGGLYIYDEYSDYEQLNTILDESFRYKMVRAMKNFNIDQVIYMTSMIVDKVVGTGDHLMIDLQELFTYDQDTFQHSVNVSVLATTCGVGLGLGNDELENLALAGVLHDVGKRAIPKEILNKEGALTDEERHAMMQHPQCGYDMLYDNTNISAFVRSAILSHHENWDGSGYPNHLAGKDIPEFGMIIHIADVYDALIRKRTYKDKFLQKEAIEYLMANCGTMFDLDLVNTFLNYLVVYPVGSTVTLSTGQTARVVQNRRKAIMRPVVVTEDGKEVIDLANDRNYLNVVIEE